MGGEGLSCSEKPVMMLEGVLLPDGTSLFAGGARLAGSCEDAVAGSWAEAVAGRCAPVVLEEEAAVRSCEESAAGPKEGWAGPPPEEPCDVAAVEVVGGWLAAVGGAAA